MLASSPTGGAGFRGGVDDGLSPRGHRRRTSLRRRRYGTERVRRLYLSMVLACETGDTDGVSGTVGVVLLVGPYCESQHVAPSHPALRARRQGVACPDAIARDGATCALSMLRRAQSAAWPPAWAAWAQPTLAGTPGVAPRPLVSAVAKRGLVPNPLRPRDHAEAIALFRAEVIGSLTRRDLTRGGLAAELRQFAARRFTPPGGRATATFAVSTLERWFYAHRKGAAWPRLCRSHAATGVEVASSPPSSGSSTSAANIRSRRRRSFCARCSPSSPS